MSCFQVRTDLALEARERLDGCRRESCMGAWRSSGEKSAGRLPVSSLILKTEQKPWGNRWVPMSHWKRRH